MGYMNKLIAIEGFWIFKEVVWCERLYIVVLNVYIFKYHSLLIPNNDKNKYSLILYMYCF